MATCSTASVPATASARPPTSVTSATPMTLIEIPAAVVDNASDSCQKQFNRAFVRVLIERMDKLSRANSRLAMQLLDAQSKA
jgi:hypothetical protein